MEFYKYTTDFTLLELAYRVMFNQERQYLKYTVASYKLVTFCELKKFKHWINFLVHLLLCNIITMNTVWWHLQ